MWNSHYHWNDAGHEWSKPWGSASDQWVATIFRRIFPLLPTEALLEIAPGFGRWVPYLIDNSESYIGIDMSERCIDHCRRSYAAFAKKPRFIVGDGVLLNGVADCSLSLVFSFDSLVHVELDVLSSYAREISRVLKPGTHAFLHHSNIGEYLRDGALTVKNHGNRGVTVSADTAFEAFTAAGLRCLVQEKNQWVANPTGEFTDCFSLLQKPSDATKAADRVVFYNRNFAQEAAISRTIADSYSRKLGIQIVDGS